MDPETEFDGNTMLLNCSYSFIDKLVGIVEEVNEIREQRHQTSEDIDAIMEHLRLVRACTYNIEELIKLDAKKKRKAFRKKCKNIKGAKAIEYISPAMSTKAIEHVE